MIEPEERLHVWNFDQLTKEGFVKLMLDAAHDLELYQNVFSDTNIENANKLREVGRRVHYSGDAYGEDPKEYYTKNSKPLELYKKTRSPKIRGDIVEECLTAITKLAEPVIDEIEGLLISKRWHKIPDGDLQLALLIEKRDSYCFVSDLLLPLWKGLWGLEEREGEI